MARGEATRSAPATLESGCFVACATAWLDSDQQARIMQDTGREIEPISGGCFTAIVSPECEWLGEPLRSGEGAVIADLDFRMIDKRKRMMDSRGRYSRPELLSPRIDRPPAAHVHDRGAHPIPVSAEEFDEASERADGHPRDSRRRGRDASHGTR